MASNIRDIARRAGVSEMTVSRVLNDYPHVSAATRAKVERIVKKCGYRMNLFARHLSKGKALDAVGIIIGLESLFEMYYASEIIRLVEEHLARNRLFSAIYNIPDTTDTGINVPRLEMLCTLYDSKLLKGVLVIGPPVDDGRVRHLAARGVRGVIVGGRCRGARWSTIREDSGLGARLLARHVAGELGHRRIGLITGPERLSASRERRQALIAELRRCDVTVNPGQVVTGEFTRESGRDAARELLAGKNRPTAIIAANDSMALGVYDEAQARGLRIPEDLSVAGFDGTSAAAHASPPLTTVAQPYADLAREAADCLINDRYGVSRILPVSLLARESTRHI